MAISKNPDWHVWFNDFWRSVSRPPGIYIAVIVALAGYIIYSNSRPLIAHFAGPSPVVYAPVAGQPAPVLAPIHSLTSDATSSVPPSDDSSSLNKCRQFPGTAWVASVGDCLPIYHEVAQDNSYKGALKPGHCTVPGAVYYPELGGCVSHTTDPAAMEKYRGKISDICGDQHGPVKRRLPDGGLATYLCP